MEIDSIVNSLKTMSQVSNYKIYVSGSLPMNVGFRLKAKATQADLKKFDKSKDHCPIRFCQPAKALYEPQLFHLK